MTSRIERLNALVAALIPDNSFYTRKLEGLVPAGGFSSLADFCERVPFTTKEEISEDHESHPPYGSNLTYPLARYTRAHQTSGTTGAPIRWLDTPEDWEWMLDNWRRVYEAANVSDEDRVFFAFSFGPFLGFWTAFDAATRLGCLCVPGGGMSTSARVKAILDHQATVLCCTPTYAIRLAQVAEREGGVDLSGSAVRAILVAGETGGSIPATRDRIESLWPGSRVFDHHGMTEVGPVSYEEESDPGNLRIIESSYLAEVIDPRTGEMAREGDTGATGELVLTTLGRTGSPLLRYRTGDLVRMECSTSGDGDARLVGGILGRADDMAVVRGVNVYPSAVENLVRRFPEVEEYRVEIGEVDGMTEMNLHVEPSSDIEALDTRLVEAFRETLNLRVRVDIAAPDSLPRFEMKAKRWIRV